MDTITGAASPVSLEPPFGRLLLSLHARHICHARRASKCLGEQNDATGQSRQFDDPSHLPTLAKRRCGGRCPAYQTPACGNAKLLTANRFKGHELGSSKIPRKCLFGQRRHPFLPPFKNGAGLLPIPYRAKTGSVMTVDFNAVKRQVANNGFGC